MVLFDTVSLKPLLEYPIIKCQSPIKHDIFFRFCENTLSWLPDPLILTLNGYLYYAIAPMSVSIMLILTYLYWSLDTSMCFL